MKNKKIFIFSPEITLGDILQVFLTILTIVLGIRYATSEVKDTLSKQTETFNQQILLLFPQLPVVEWHEGEVHPFDGGSSSIKIVSIDPVRKEVKVQFNIKGNLIDNILIMGKTRTISIPQGRTYTFLLTGIDMSQERKTAKFIIREVKE